MHYRLFCRMILVTFPFKLLLPQTAAPMPPSSLAAMRGHLRPLLLFGAPGDPRVQQQIDLLQRHRSDLIERQVMLVPFLRKYAGPVDPQTVTFLPQEEAALRRRFHTDDSLFTVILIGKDGGEKLRSEQPVSIETINQTIDAMPMRQTEARAPHGTSHAVVP